MRVMIYDVIGPATKQFRAECDIRDYFPDDKEAMRETIAEIERCGQSWIGGGAAPLVILEAA
jgi:hypothetical protein